MIPELKKTAESKMHKSLEALKNDPVVMPPRPPYPNYQKK